MKKMVVIVLNLIMFTGVFADNEVFNYIHRQVPIAEDAKIIYEEIIKYADAYSIDPKLIVSVIKTESNFKRVAESHKGAMGLMQVMPFHFNKSTENGKNISDNLRVGTRVLARCLNQSGGDIPIALAMYNAGEGAVKKYGGIPPYKETQGYITKVLGIYNNTFNYSVPYYAYTPAKKINEPSTTIIGQPNKQFNIAWGESNFSVFPEESSNESK